MYVTIMLFVKGSRQSSRALMAKPAKKPKPEPQKPANPVGRPTKYKPEYCQKLIKHMSKGLSFECFGATIGVARDAVYEWPKKHPEFAEAKAAALDASLLWWEEQGQKGMWVDKEGPVLNNTIWVFSMKNRHGWRDNRDMNVQQDVTINPIKEDLKKLTTKELMDLAFCKGKK